MKNALFVITSNVSGGGELFFLEMVSRLDRTKFRVFVACPKSCYIWNELCVNQDIYLKELPIGPKLGIKTILDIALWPIYLVHFLTLFLKLNKKDSIDFCFFQYKKEQLIGSIAAFFFGIPVFWVEHTPVYNMSFGIARLLKPFYRFVGKLAVTKLIVFSKKAADSLTKIRIPEKKIRILNIGVDLTIYKGASNFGLSSKIKVVGVVSRLATNKGIENVIGAMPQILRKYPDVELHIAGTGNFALSLKKLSEDLALGEKVKFYGYIHNSKIPEFLDHVHVYVMPSYSEGTPLSLIEAMAAAKVIIATDVGAVTEMMRDGFDGLIVSAQSTSAIADSILRVFGNWDSYQQLGLNARKTALVSFDINRTVRSFEDVFMENT
ncbi:MAG: hypothetical protein A2270_07355 [Elusimicrobia bacterium RIFOXYA12_FULL_51_18]|nr:MAG: hypothetical protein A2270_07355 [Elusimicrobia bacterium RIFOXYA12_FULL_51_18]OGS28499.1 MAG: hypothetical protein A2218_05660 [Elusimicrobia bacterium RIFOXYA2_FULL_53_38]